MPPPLNDVRVDDVISVTNLIRISFPVVPEVAAEEAEGDGEEAPPRTRSSGNFGTGLEDRRRRRLGPGVVGARTRARRRRRKVQSARLTVHQKGINTYQHFFKFHPLPPFPPT